MSGRYRNVAFLAELLINILVFSISCAVLAGMFGKAGQIARETRGQSAATQEVYALFETIRAGGPAYIPEGAAPQGDGSYELYYDKNWNPAGAEDANYTINLTFTDEDAGAGVLRSIAAEASDHDGNALCGFSTKTYHPAEGAAGA